jgi:hypothetical protein
VLSLQLPDDSHAAIRSHGAQLLSVGMGSVGTLCGGGVGANLPGAGDSGTATISGSLTRSLDTVIVAVGDNLGVTAAAVGLALHAVSNAVAHTRHDKRRRVTTRPEVGIFCAEMAVR